MARRAAIANPTTAEDVDLGIGEGEIMPQGVIEHQSVQAESEHDAEEWGGWDGTETAIRLAHPLLRDHKVAGPGEKCVHCGAKTHHFHVRASEPIPGSGQWIGPEGVHVMDLQRMGFIAGTPQAVERARQQAMVDGMRGTYGSDERPEGWPELREQSTADVKGQLAQMLMGGPSEVIAKERQQSRSDAAQLAGVLKALGVDPEVFAGAKAPARRG